MNAKYDLVVLVVCMAATLCTACEGTVDQQAGGGSEMEMTSTTICEEDTLGVAECYYQGGCVPGAATPCAPYTCDATEAACKTSCFDDSDCAAGFSCEASVCEPPKPWSKTFGGTTVTYGVATDSTGNVLLTGHFHGAVDFGGGPLQSEGWDVFLVKLDPSGNHLWSKGFGGSVWETGSAIAVDSADNVYVGGNFQKQISFGGEVFVAAGGTSSSYDAFAVKFDAGGKHIWSQRFAGLVGEAEAVTALAVDAVDNLILVGAHYGDIYLGGANLGATRMFVAKLSSDGGHMWSKGFLATVRGVAAFNDIVVVGQYYDADFGGGKLPNNGDADGFIVKFDGTGKHLWSIGCGGSSHDVATDVALDGKGAIVVTGSFKKEMACGGSKFLAADNDHYDVFVAKLDGTGKHLWSEAFVGLGINDAHAITTDSEDNLLLTGSMGKQLQVGGLSASTPYYGVYLAKLGPAGAPLAVETVVGSPKYSVVATDKSNSVLWAASTYDQTQLQKLLP